MEEQPFQVNEKDKLEKELILARIELTKALEYQKEYMRSLNELMYMISHKLRQPITQIMGIFYLLEEPVNSQNELKAIAGYLKDSVVALDGYTRDLTVLIRELTEKSDR